MSRAEAERKMPALFVGHGSPMNAIEDNSFRRGWEEVARRLPKPEKVLCVSAHWETAGVYVTAAERPATIHDFYGFPAALSEMRYPAPGSPSLAQRVAELLAPLQVGLDSERGLDHGCWGVLVAMFPGADVPVVQLSLETRQPGRFHYSLGQRLASLRNEGVLIVASGNIVHNLRFLSDGRAHDWALRFDQEIKKRILAGEHQELIAYETLGPDARLAVPSPEHYLPLLYVLAVQEKGERVTFFNDRVVGSISMTSLVIGG